MATGLLVTSMGSESAGEPVASAQFCLKTLLSTC